MKEFTYKAEDIFEDIDGDKDNVTMKIPPEVCEKMGWEEGDILKVEPHEGGGIKVTRVKKEKSE